MSRAITTAPAAHRDQPAHHSRAAAWLLAAALVALGACGTVDVAPSAKDGAGGNGAAGAGAPDGAAGGGGSFSAAGGAGGATVAAAGSSGGASSGASGTGGAAGAADWGPQNVPLCKAVLVGWVDCQREIATSSGQWQCAYDCSDEQLMAGQPTPQGTPTHVLQPRALNLAADGACRARTDPSVPAVTYCVPPVASGDPCAACLPPQ